MTRVANLLLCLYGDSSLGFGIMRAKAETIANYLERPLEQIAST